MAKLTEAQKRELKPGQLVVVRDDFGRKAVWEVKYAPWQLGHGEWVIGLKGKAGGYALSRVSSIASPGYLDAERALLDRPLSPP